MCRRSLRELDRGQADVALLASGCRALRAQVPEVPLAGRRPTGIGAGLNPLPFAGKDAVWIRRRCRTVDTARAIADGPALT